MWSGKVRATVGYYLAIMALGLSTAALGPTLPALAKQTHSDLADASWLFVAGSGGYLLGSLLAGRVYDRWRGHPLLGASLLLLAAMLALAPLMASLWWLAGVLFVLGVAQGGVDVGGNTLLVWVHQDRVGPWMNGLHFWFGIGSVLAPLIVAWTAASDQDLTWPYWTFAALAVPAALWLFPLASPPAPQAQTTRSEEGRWLLVVWIALYLGLYAAAEFGFGGWIYSYAVESQLAGTTDAAYLTTAFWAAFTAGRLLGVPLSLRIAPHWMLLGDLAGSLTGLSIILVWSHSALALTIGTVVTGLSMASVFPVTLSLAESRLTITASVTGWFIVGAAAGSMTLPWLMGQLFTSAGPRAAIVALLVDLLLATGVLAGLLMRSRSPRTTVVTS